MPSREATWDVVIDDSATNPDWVRQSTELLRDAAGRYLFTSSTGVYYPYLKRGYDERDAPHTELKDPKDGSETFGVNKALCEQQVQRVFGDRTVVIRPTYIIGPGDTTDRFPYWPVRLARGGDVLAPGKKDDPVAFIDVRDLAEFMVTLVEQRRTGIYNVVGPKRPMTSREFYERAQKAINPSARLIYVDDYDVLSAHGIDAAVPWVMLKGNDEGHQSVKNDKVIEAGLGFRPIEQTIQDTLAWWPTVARGTAIEAAVRDLPTRPRRRRLRRGGRAPRCERAFTGSRLPDGFRDARRAASRCRMAVCRPSPAPTASRRWRVGRPTAPTASSSFRMR